MKTRSRTNESSAPAVANASGERRTRRRPETPEADGLVALDPLIHERTRLTILTALSTANESACSFLDLRDALRLTDGNLLTHLRTLEEAGLLQRHKTGAGRGSSTTVQLTAAGRRAFLAYLEQLESLVRKARGQEAP